MVKHFLSTHKNSVHSLKPNLKTPVILTYQNVHSIHRGFAIICVLDFPMPSLGLLYVMFQIEVIVQLDTSLLCPLLLVLLK